MDHIRKFPKIALGAILSLALAAPAAQASDHDAAGADVCNQATPHSLGGSLTATDGDPTPPARYRSGLREHPGQGAGLVNAAGRSPALSLCGSEDGGGEDGGGDDWVAT